MSVLRFDPFAELDRLSEQMGVGRRAGSVRSFPMDAYRRGDRFFVHLDLPGVDSDSIELTSEQNVLTIEGERKFSGEVAKDQYHRLERGFGAFRRSFTLPATLDASRVSASYVDGVLTVKLPQRAEAKPRQIEVNG